MRGKPGQDALVRAQKLAKDGNLDGAIAACKEAASQNPQLEDAYLLMGSACAMKGDGACEVGAYDQGLAALPRSAALLRERGLLHLQAGAAPKALPMLEEASQLKGGKDAEYLADLGYAYLVVGRAKDALTQVNNAIALNPKCFQCAMALGEIHLQQKAFDDAAQAYMNARALNGKDPGPVRKLAVTYFFAGKGAEAMSTFDEAIALAPDDPNLKVQAAQVAIKLGKSKKAIPMLQKVLEMAPDNKQLLQLLMNAQKKAGDKKGARATKAKLKKLG